MMIKSGKIAVDWTRSPTEKDSCLTLLQSDAETNDGRVQMNLLSFEPCCGMEFSRLLQEMLYSKRSRCLLNLFENNGRSRTAVEKISADGNYCFQQLILKISKYELIQNLIVSSKYISFRTASPLQCNSLKSKNCRKWRVVLFQNVFLITTWIHLSYGKNLCT